MINIIELPFGEDVEQKIYIEIKDELQDNVIKKTGFKNIFTKSDKKFEDVKLALINYCKPIKEALVSEINPDEATIEFGLKFDISGNWVLAASTLATHLKISMKWKK